MAADMYAELPLVQLVCEKQARTEFDEAKLSELAESVRAVGIQLPLKVRREGERFVVIDGERRLRAAALAGLKIVPVVIEGQELEAGQILQRQLITNCQREDLKPLEQANALKQLIETTGWTAATAAQKLGLSPASISKSLALLSLSQVLQQKVAAGEITASAAYELARVNDPARQAELAEQLSDGTLTRDGLRGSKRKPEASAKLAPPTRLVVALDAARSITLTGGCSSLENLIQWLEELLGKARKVRQQGVALTTFVKMLKDQAKGGVQ